jgi:iron complex transport system substrate-binding protein
MRSAGRLALLISLLAPVALQAQVPSPRAVSAAAAPATRVVSLLPAATEILIALEASNLLVARTETDTTRALAGLPSVGQVLWPNLEVLASVQPDLVIGWASSDLTPISRLLERHGGRVERLALDRLEDVIPAILKIGAWVGRMGAADGLAASVSRTFEEARSAGGRGWQPRVLWVVWSEPIVVAGADTFISDVIELAGGLNAAGAVGAPWPRVGIESLVALDPDVLVWPEGPGLFSAAELRTRTGWRNLSAVEVGRVLVVDPERFHDPGPEIAVAALELARRLARTTPR